MRKAGVESYYLKPSQGWENYTRHSELVDHIYETYIPLVNQGKWHYLNFAPDLGIFEDSNGNYLYIDYRELDNSEESLVIEMMVEYKSKENEGFLNRIEALKSGFGLSMEKIDLKKIS